MGDVGGEETRRKARHKEGFAVVQCSAAPTSKTKTPSTETVRRERERERLQNGTVTHTVPTCA